MKNLLLAIMFCALLFCGYVQYFKHDSPSVSTCTEIGKLVESIEPMQERILECGTHLLSVPDGLINDNKPKPHFQPEAIANNEYSVEALDLTIDLDDTPDDIERAVEMVLPPTDKSEVDSKEALKQAMVVLNNLKAEFVVLEKTSQ
ncbi:hypothetical protein [Pseudoalteromonas sp. C12FD-1]|uniref:hypothetical protein n=1 Tax=Pseudoalteromonas sp. C12FD-1 TaxID=3131979 RepID=UPI00307DEF21